MIEIRDFMENLEKKNVEEAQKRKFHSYAKKAYNGSYVYSKSTTRFYYEI